MLKIEQLSDELEAIVDRTSFGEVLEALALMCSAKADHILENWADQTLAEHWEQRIGWLLTVRDKAGA